MLLALQPAAGDCEAIGGGLVGQPANAISSLAFVLVGIGLLVVGTRNDGPSASGFAVAVVGVGVGSAVFHGPMPSWGRFAHDLPLAVVFMVVALLAGLRARLWQPRAAVAATVAGTGASAGILVALPNSAVPLTILLAGAAIVLELAAHGRRPAKARSRARVAYAAIVLLVVPAAVVNLLGRTGGILCSPDSILQPHAAWHVATAVALGLYGWALVSRPAAPPP